MAERYAKKGIHVRRKEWFSGGFPAGNCIEVGQDAIANPQGNRPSAPHPNLAIAALSNFHVFG